MRRARGLERPPKPALPAGLDDGDSRAPAPLEPTRSAGLTRNVLVFESPSESAYIHRVATFPVNASTGEIHANVSLLGAAVPSSVSLRLAWNGGADGPAQQYHVHDGTAVLTGLRVPDFRPWAIGKPSLFTLRVTLLSAAAQPVDAVEVRSGVRVLSVRSVDGAARVAVNGEAVKLVGVNRHTMWPDTGSGLSLEQVQADLALLQSLNVNWVRGAHYPQDQRFLDLLDEAGIGMWEETLGPGVSTSDLESDYWMRYQLQQVAEMVETSANHPSVLYHAFYNEGPSSDHRACDGYNSSATAIRQRVTTAGSPPSRLITYASDKKTSDVCLGVTDVVSFNNYPCWYGPEHCDDPKSKISSSWNGSAQWANKNFPGKPFGISETGAGGVFEWTNSSDVRWSQGYQTEVVAANAEFASKSPLVNHFTIWQFNDIKADEGDTSKCGQCRYAPHPNNLTVPWNCDYIDGEALSRALATRSALSPGPCPLPSLQPTSCLRSHVRSPWRREPQGPGRLLAAQEVHLCGARVHLPGHALSRRQASAANTSRTVQLDACGTKPGARGHRCSSCSERPAATLRPIRTGIIHAERLHRKARRRRNRRGPRRALCNAARVKRPLMHIYVMNEPII